MSSCEYCDKPATEKRRVYSVDMNCSIEVEVCEECATYIDDQNYYNTPEPYKEA